MCFASQFEGTSKRAGRAGQQEHEAAGHAPSAIGKAKRGKALFAQQERYAQLASLVQSCAPSVARI